MIYKIAFIMMAIIGPGYFNNKHSDKDQKAPFSMVGTWRLINGTTIEKGDTVVTDYTKGTSFIKIINNTHFSFLKHDLKNGKESNATYDSGGGTYTLKKNVYTEHLEYCQEREWENHDFTFNVEITNDTLTQSGIEKVENANVNRINIERYVRLKTR